jgi:ankyrin repeat protein
LIQAGARVEGSLLFTAWAPGVVAALLEAGADPLYRAHSGLNALFSPAAAHHAHAVRALVGAGVDVNAVSTQGHTALCRAQTLEVVQALLLASATVHVDAVQHQTPFSSPAAASDVRACQALIAAGADVNGQGPGGCRAEEPPVAFAGCAEVLHALLAAGASIAYAEGAYPGVTSRAQESGALCAAFVAAGASMDPGVCGLLPTLPAAYNQGVVQALIDAGANVHHCDPEDGQTALHMARSPDAVLGLLEAGAGVGTRDGAGQTPLHTVGSAAVARLLLDAGVCVCVLGVCVLGVPWQGWDGLV